jgi:hypothetical protein
MYQSPVRFIFDLLERRTWLEGIDSSPFEGNGEKNLREARNTN